MTGADCPTRAGSDPCYLPNGHDGDHWTYWSKLGQVPIRMYWRGNEPWSHTNQQTQ